MSKRKRPILLALVGVLLLPSHACTDASAPARDAPAKQEQAPSPAKAPSEEPAADPAKEALPAAEEVLARAVEAISCMCGLCGGGSAAALRPMRRRSVDQPDPVSERASSFGRWAGHDAWKGMTRA